MKRSKQVDQLTRDIEDLVASFALRVIKLLVQKFRYFDRCVSYSRW